MFKVPEKFRIKTGLMSSCRKDGNKGVFIIPQKKNKPDLTVVASDGAGWEHVSVSTSIRTPTWSEMCKIKDLFWGDECCVLQFHPPRADYINNHPFCLHLWRNPSDEVKTPPWQLVGGKGLTFAF